MAGYYLPEAMCSHLSVQEHQALGPFFGSVLLKCQILIHW